MPQIQPIDIVAPGAFGLNTEQANTLLRPTWAIIADNAVVSRSGRLSSRKGWQNQSTTVISGAKQIDVLFEYLNKAGTSTIISTADNKIYKDVDDYTDAGNNIVSTTAPSNDNWQFVNFNNKVLGFQKGHAPIEWAGSSVFTDASYTGTGPDGNCAVAAFGRVWAADADLQTLRYSVLLDDTDYSGANGGGTIDMASVWTKGMDEIVAIIAIGSNIVVFGRNHILMWADGSGSEIGLDPTRLELVDTIEGTGCIARDSVQVTGEGDVIFLSRHGLQSLGRVIQSKSNPTVALTKNVRKRFLTDVDTQRTSDAKFDQVRSAWSPEEGIYVITFPAPNKQWVVDTQHAFKDQDGDTVFPITNWVIGNGTLVGLVSTIAGKLFFGLGGQVGKYAGENDNTVGYSFIFETGWLDFEDLNHRLKMLKEIGVSAVIGSGSVTWTWEWDFDGQTLSRTVSYSQDVSEWSVAEYNIGEYAGGAAVQRRSIPAFGEGQFLKLGCKATVNGFGVIVQHMSVAPKIGKMVV